MDVLANIGRWISENESLLSGSAALIVVAGFVLSPLGAGIRRLFRSSPVPPQPGQAVSDVAASDGPDPLTLKELTAPSPDEIRFARSGAARIAFNQRGSGPVDLVVTPGIISNLNILGNLPASRDFLRSLSGFARVLTFDKRGQGLSDPSLATPALEDRTGDIEAVMDTAGIQRAILVGVSEGGPMCIHFAHSHPDRVLGLIMVGTTARFTQSEDFPIGIPQHHIEQIATLWGTGALRDILFPSLSRELIDDDTYKSMERLMGSRATLRQLVEMMAEIDVRALLPDIRVPTLVVHFSGDLAIPIRLGRYLAENIPDAEFLEVNAVDHADLSQSPQAIERIRGFCEDIARKGLPRFTGNLLSNRPGDTGGN